MGTGITTWIKEHVLRGVPFTRRGCKGMGSPQSGLLKGRKVDLAFKSFCTTGAAPAGSKTWVVRRIAAIQSSLRKANVTVHSANVFVQIGQLKTHIDGVGTHGPSGETVVLELKSTQSSLESHRKAYDVACSLQPTVLVNNHRNANTERLHHSLQLAFGVHGLPAAKRGYVIISASDGAALYPLNRGIPLHAFTSAPTKPAASKPKPAAKPPRKTLARKRAAFKPIKWPGCNVVLPPWREVRKVKRGVVIIRRDTKIALATAVSARSQIAAAKTALADVRAHLSDPPQFIFVLRPTKRAWICHSSQ